MTAMIGIRNWFEPRTQQELQTRIAAEQTSGRRYLPWGGGTNSKAWENLQGWKSSDVGVKLKGLDQLLDYPSGDMTITVEAGMTVGGLQKLLRKKDQCIPVEAACSQQATLGGWVASNFSGPLRFGCGTLRDYLIGFAAVDGTGQRFQAGGRVVKNVAGYDLCKLMVGSMGSLAVLTELTFKVWPLPEAEAVLWTGWRDFAEAESACRQLMTSSARPVILEVFGGDSDFWSTEGIGLELPSTPVSLAVAVQGMSEAVHWQVAQLQQELIPLNPMELQVFFDQDARNSRHAIAEIPCRESLGPYWEAHLLPSRTMAFCQSAADMALPVKAHAGNGVIYVFPSRPSTDLPAAALQNLRQTVQNSGGSLLEYRRGTEKPGWEHAAQDRGGLDLMHKLKKQFDPNGLLHPGWIPQGRNGC